MLVCMYIFLMYLLMYVDIISPKTNDPNVYIQFMLLIYCTVHVRVYKWRTIDKSA